MTALFFTHEMGGGKVTHEWRNASEIKLSQDRNVMFLRATGGGSHSWLLTAYTDRNSSKYRLHFGLLLEQKGVWKLTWNKVTHKGKYLLIDHLGTKIRIAVFESFESAGNKLTDVFDDVKMDLEQSYMGYSSAACWRWLKDEVMNRHLGLKYSSVYSKGGGLFCADDKTNSFRLVCAEYLHLKLPYKMAKRVTTKNNLAYWMGHIKSSKELQDCWKYALSFYEDLKRLSRKHEKMYKTINQVAEQSSFKTGSSLDFVRNI